MRPFRTGILSPPFTPPPPVRRFLPGQPRQALHPAMLGASTIHQLSMVLGEQVGTVGLLRTTPLYQLLRINLPSRRTLLVKSFTHHSTCSEAFTATIESCLQDAEDLALTLPYDHIRTAIDKHHSSLDHIQRDRLVLLTPPSGVRRLEAHESPIGPVQECMLWTDDLAAEVLEAWPAPSYVLSPAPVENGCPLSPPAENGYLTPSPTHSDSGTVTLLLCACLKSLHTIICCYHDREISNTAELNARQQLTASLVRLAAIDG